MLTSVAVHTISNFEHLATPQRSRLYHLKPIGIGTPYVESLTSYIVRLAHAYRVQPRVLVLQEILPLLSISGELKPENRLPWLRGSTTINGTTPLVNGWVQALEQLTLRQNLRFLTMLTWKDVIAENEGVVRKTRAWCPICYHEWLLRGKTIYEPLIWNVRVVTECPRHHQSLYTRCPHCEHTLPLLIDWSLPGHCPKCDGFLGFLNEMEIEQESISQEKRAWNQWLGNAIADLVAAAPTLTSPPEQDQITSGLTAYLERSGNGSIASLAKYLSVDGSKFITWQRGLHVPEFEVILRLCQRMGIASLRFLTEEASTFRFDHPALNHKHLLSDGNSRMSMEEVGQELERLLKREGYFPPSLNAVARQLQYPVQVLRHLFPKLCDTISQNYQKLLDPVNQRRVLEAMLVEPELQSLSLNEVARRLGCPVTLLQYRFPEQCRAIAQRHRKTLDLAAIQSALDAILTSQEEPPPNVNEVLARLKCSNSSLYRCFPEVCHAITIKYQQWLSSQRTKNGKRSSNDDASKRSTRHTPTKRRHVKGDTPNTPTKVLETRSVEGRTSTPGVTTANVSPRRKVVDVEQLRQALELVLASEEESPPTVTEVAKRMGFSASTLYVYFPEMCHAITNRHHKPIDINGLRRELEAVLASNEAPFPSLRKVIERLRCPETTLRRHFPEQCRAIIQRHRHGLDQDNRSVTLSAVKNIDDEIELNNAKNASAGKHGKVVDIDSLRMALEEVLMNQENPPPTMEEIAGRLGYSSSALYHYFPLQCRAIAEQHRRGVRKKLDDLKQALEEVLMMKEAPFPTVQQVAKNLGCSDAILYQNFAEYCHAIAKRHQLDRDAIRQKLQAILASDEYPPSVSEVARNLGYSIQLLTEYFPQECKEIKERHWKLTDADKQRQMLEAVLANDEQVSWFINEIAKKLGCASSTLYTRFPELCREITKRRWKVFDTDHMRQTLEEALIEQSPPTLQELAKRLDCHVKNIQYYFPELSKAVTDRRRAMFDRNTQQKALECVLESSEETISMQEASRCLGVSASSLRKRFPALCSAISANYMAHRKNGREVRIKRICEEVRQATLSVHALGDYPTITRVGALLDSPARFRMPEARYAWRETMQELGYEL